MPEMLVHGGLGKSSFRPEETDFQRLLLGQAGRHDLPEQAQHLLVTHRPFVALEDRTQHFGLAFGPVILNGRSQLPFGNADLLRDPRPIIDQRLEPPVDFIDALTDLLEIQLVSFSVSICHPALPKNPKGFLRLQACPNFAMPTRRRWRATLEAIHPTAPR